MITSGQMSAAQRSYEARLDRELERLLAEDEDNYCGGDCETCDVPYCNVSTNKKEDNDNGRQ